MAIGTSTNKCQCGCGATVERMFKQGHDAKLKGKLLRAWAAGDRKAGAELLARKWSTVETLTTAKKSIKAVTEADMEAAMKQLPS